MNRRTGTAERRPWRNAIALAAAAALILTPGTTFAAKEGGGHSGGGSGGSGGGEDTSPGNNLSMPVIWTDTGLRPTLREPTTPLTAILGTLGADGTVAPLDATYVLKDDAGTKDVVEQNPLFLQKTVNAWQADNVELADSGLALSGGRLPVTYLDWGDNLEAKDWSTKQMVRVETRLLQKVDGMTGYVMKKVFGQGQTEMWGVLGKQVPADPPDPATDPWSATDEERTEAFAYTSNACLTIERIDRATSLTWDPGDGAWTPDGKSICVGDVTEGPGGYGAEVTVSGGMTYGYVWHARGAEAGLYRLTFSLKAGTGVDIAPSTERYVSATTEEGGSGHKPPGAGGHETVAEPTTDAASAEEGGEEGGTDAGHKPTPNVPVIVPELDLSYIDVGLDFDPTVATMPLNLKAVRGVEQIALTWEPPVYDGMAAITEYLVTGVRDDDGTVVPEQRISAGAPLTATYAGLVGGEPYTFTVAAVNGQGTGVAASVTGVPKGRPQVANPSPPAASPPAAAPQVAQRAATVRVKAVAGKSALRVNVNPNKGKGYWQVMIQKKSGKVWKALPRVHRTKGSAETLTVDLPKGAYRAVVLPKYGHVGTTSRSVTLKR